MKQCLTWMTLHKRDRDLFVLAAEQSEKWVFHVHPRVLFVSVCAEKAEFFLVLHCSALP